MAKRKFHHEHHFTVPDEELGEVLRIANRYAQIGGNVEARQGVAVDFRGKSLAGYSVVDIKFRYSSKKVPEDLGLLLGRYKSSSRVGKKAS